MTNPLDFLPPLSWRGKTYPVMDRQVGFIHENVDHRIQYRSNDYPEPIGPHSFLFRYTIPMRQDIFPGKYGELFNEGLPLLITDMRNKEPGDLNDPILGLYRCVPVSYQETTDVNKRNGTDVHVEFLHAPRIGDTDPELPQTITGIVGLAGDRGLSDTDLAKQDWEQEPSPEGVTDILSAIDGIGKQGLRQVDKIAANLSSLAAKLQEIEDTADKIENPQNWQIRDSARELHLAVLKAKDRISEDPATKTRRLVVKTTTTISRLAAESGLTIGEILASNPGLARSPYIAKGTKVFIKTKTDKSRSR